MHFKQSFLKYWKFKIKSLKISGTTPNKLEKKNLKLSIQGWGVAGWLKFATCTADRSQEHDLLWPV
jgi:hypothetical protein